MATVDYKSLYFEMGSKLDELQQKRTDLEVQLGDVTTEIRSLEAMRRYLAPLAGFGIFEESVAELGITEAVRAVLNPTDRMSAAEIKAKMEQKDFDFSGYSAPDASIRTILKRLVEAGKAEVEKEGHNTFYKLLYTDEDIPF
jgi:hypothetical protein